MGTTELRTSEPGNGPFILVSDDDCHFYVISKAKRTDWSAWLESEDAQLGDVPAYADRVPGDPSLVEFTRYTIR